MRLIPWRESESLSTLQHRMNRLFEDFFTAPDTEPAPWLPAIDVAETEKEIVVKAEMPGLDPRDLEISVVGDALQIRGEKRQESERKGESWHRVERRYGTFSRTVPLPCAVDVERAVAEAHHGVLTVKLAKSAEHQPRKIDIRAK